MEKKKFSIELPKGGMSDLTKQVRNSPITEPPADATEWQRFTRYLDEFKNVSEHGECVWLFKDVANVSGCLRMSNERLSASNLNLMQNSISGS